jgi:hypothetical protein
MQGDLLGKGGESLPKPKKKGKSKAKAKVKAKAKAKPIVKKKEKAKPRATQIDDLREFVCENERGVCFTDNMGNKIYPGHIGLLTDQQGENLIRANMGAWRE